MYVWWPLRDEKILDVKMLVRWLKSSALSSYLLIFKKLCAEILLWKSWKHFLTVNTSFFKWCNWRNQVSMTWQSHIAHYLQDWGLITRPSGQGPIIRCPSSLTEAHLPAAHRRWPLTLSGMEAERAAGSSAWEIQKKGEWQERRRFCRGLQLIPMELWFTVSAP